MSKKEQVEKKKAIKLVVKRMQGDRGTNIRAGFTVELVNASISGIRQEMLNN